MKPFTKGLITGILLTVSAMMFMGAVAIQNYDDYYDRKINRIVQNIDSSVSRIESSVSSIESEVSGGVYCYDGNVSCH